jgi:predicted RNase H-like nuclease
VSTRLNRVANGDEKCSRPVEIAQAQEFLFSQPSLMFVAGVDGCRAGWVAFKVDVPSLATSVDVVDIAELLSRRPDDLLCLAIDIPIGLLNGSRACDKAARKLLGQPRGTSVFAAPCRATLSAASHAPASALNREKTTRGLSQQAWGIAPKIKQVDDAIAPDCQKWAFEVHPDVCFWAMNDHRPMKYNKKTKEGAAERVALLRNVFPEIERHLANRPTRVGADDLLDAAAAAWTALRWYRKQAECVCTPERDEKGLEVTIYY